VAQLAENFGRHDRADGVRRLLVADRIDRLDPRRQRPRRPPARRHLAPPPQQSSPPPPASPPPAAAASAATSTSFTGRVKSWFTGDSNEALAAAPSPTQASIDFDCPNVDYRQGAATLSVNDSKAENPALSLKYQASFVKTARECDVRGDMVTMRVGVQGRVVVGPAGGPGTVTVPLRYALVREGIEPRTIWTKLFVLNVPVPNTQLNVPFTHIEEEMTVPVPPPSNQCLCDLYWLRSQGLKPVEKLKPVAVEGCKDSWCSSSPSADVFTYRLNTAIRHGASALSARAGRGMLQCNEV
jgi:hypothetical protein